MRLEAPDAAGAAGRPLGAYCFRRKEGEGPALEGSFWVLRLKKMEIDKAGIDQMRSKLGSAYLREGTDVGGGMSTESGNAPSEASSSSSPSSSSSESA